MKATCGRGAFTLVEVLVVTGVISVLIALLLPAVQMARETSRRAACQENLRQVGVAFHGFENVHGRLPMGARCRKLTAFGLYQPTFSVSWWVDALPFLDEGPVAAALDTMGASNGLVGLHPKNGRVVDGVVISVMFCPSSPLPKLSNAGGGGFQVGMPSYVGISGAMADEDFSETRLSRVRTPTDDGYISAGGVLISNSAVRLREVLDGTSHTVMVSEAGDFCFTETGEAWRVDGGFPLGWLAGTVAPGTPPDYDPDYSRPSWNVTTIRHPLNSRNFQLPGVDDNHGANNPLLSAHPGGVSILNVDGSVHFLVDETSVLALKRMATRDDGFGANRDSAL